MRLRLTVISDHRRDLADLADHEFSEAGGVIGRSTTADWALPDPTKTVSSRHALVTFADGTFRITDTSTNGVYLNSVDVPLGRGATMPLRSGDTLYVGPYVIRAEIVADVVDGRQRLGLDAGWKSVRSERQPLPAPRVAGLDDLLAPGRGAESDGVLAAGPATPPPQRPPPERPRPPVDPIAGLDDRPADDALSAGIGRRDDDLLGPAPRPGHGALVSRAAAPAPIIPPTFDPLAGTAAAPVVPVPPVPRAPAADPWPQHRAPPLPPAPPHAAPVQAAPYHPAPAPPLPGRAAPLPPAPRPETAPPTDVMALLRLRALAADGPAPQAEHGAEGHPADVLAAMGIDPAALTPDATRRAIAALAAFVLQAADGLVEVLETRRTLKDELHLEHTRLGATDNNPFKFFATGRETLRQMLTLEPPGFVSLAAGAGEAFADLREHEFATMTAVQATAATLLGRLSPSAIETTAEAGGFLGRVDKARLWDRYVEAHGRAVETLDVAVAELVAQHYAEALRRAPGSRPDQRS
jgi:type VI secretion system FHA domain protein